MTGLPKTLPLASSRGKTQSDEVSLLIKIGQSHRPLEPSPRVLELQRGGVLELCRGEEEAFEPEEGRALLDDPWMSTGHARVFSLGGPERNTFVLEDRGSTNGTRLNGQEVGHHELASGDIVETGRTFWRFYRGPLEKREVLELAHRGGEITPLASVSPRFLAAVSRLRDVADTDIPLFILGETGVGKEVVSAEIHRLSGRQGRFVALNCGAIPEGLVESEIFGHHRGAFTGATETKRGVVEEADEGTLLLDEVGDMSPACQVKVLRLLQDGTFVRVGENQQRRVDVRYIAATHRDLESMVKEGAFRGDLFARLNGLNIRLPALVERVEDIGLLLAVFLRRVGAEAAAITQEAFRLLLLHDWPFNVRELEQVVSSAVALSRRSGTIEPEHLPEALRGAREGEERGPDAAGSSDEQLRAKLTRLLTTHRGNLSAVARELETSRSQIHRWLKRVGLDPEAFR
jgi:transcriptional regulator with PAS, ATPase and Fis domain